MDNTTATPNPAVQITATTTKAAKLKNILRGVEALVALGLPIFLSLNHNPETGAEVEAGVEAVTAITQGLTGAQPLG